MSWLRAAAELHPASEEEAEVFDEGQDEMELVQREWKRSMEQRLREGYLDGIEAGKENSLQTGFNSGYKLGVSMLMPCGELRGTLSALVTWCQVHQLEPSMTTQLGELLTSVCQCEDHIVKVLSSIHQVAHPTDLSSSLEDMDLASHIHEADKRSCSAGQDCCHNQESLPSSLLSGCRTTQQLSDVVKQELSRILGDTHAIAQQLNMSEDLLYYLQSLKTMYLTS
ncbi:protein YAE1 homolog [Pseudophryne corroboree]|uniref:protein YAE1 homolog n=1 Tax=Pseudophryne corroboree TaxID=495146 RepID=UPI00308164C0